MKRRNDPRNYLLQKNACRVWLRGFLIDKKEIAFTEILKEARKKNYSRSTVYIAIDQLFEELVPSGNGRKRYWKLK